MKANIIKTHIKDLLVLETSVFTDERGIFIKTFHNEFFRNEGLQTNFREEYYSISNKNVLRGMHFQTPPHDHEKLIYCVAGRVLDVIVDLRKKSSTFGQFFSIELKGADGKIIYIPKGFAHGFCALEDNSFMMYKVSTEYSQKHDKGIKWDSIGFQWPIQNPILSGRDQSFPALDCLDSPF